MAARNLYLVALGAVLLAAQSRAPPSQATTPAARVDQFYDTSTARRSSSNNSSVNRTRSAIIRRLAARSRDMVSKAPTSAIPSSTRDMYIFFSVIPWAVCAVLSTPLRRLMRSTPSVAFD